MTYIRTCKHRNGFKLFLYFTNLIIIFLFIYPESHNTRYLYREIGVYSHTIKFWRSFENYDSFFLNLSNRRRIFLYFVIFKIIVYLWIIISFSVWFLRPGSYDIRDQYNSVGYIIKLQHISKFMPHIFKHQYAEVGFFCCRIIKKVIFIFG